METPDRDFQYEKRDLLRDPLLTGIAGWTGRQVGWVTAVTHDMTTVRWLFVVIGIVKTRARMPGWLSVSSHTQYILVVYYMCYRLVCNVGGRWGWWWVRLVERVTATAVSL